MTYPEFYHQMWLDPLFQEVKLKPHPVIDLALFLKYMVDWVRPAVHAAVDAMKGLSFWISVLVRYTHPAKELQETHP